jgi:hypothetical protein
MPKPNYLWIICLSFSLSAICQTVNLKIETQADSIYSEQRLEFSSVKTAEQYLTFKLDSLEKAGYPFLSLNKEVVGKSIRAELNLNQKIDSLYLSLESEHLMWVPKRLTTTEQLIKISYGEFSELQDYILNNLQSKGSPFGKTVLNNLEVINGNIITADLIIDRGQERRIDKVTIKGYPKLSKNFVTKFSNLKVGSLFVESEVQDKTEQLNNIPFIEVRKPTEVLFQQDSTELFIYVEKVNANSFDGFLGFGSTEEESFQVNGFLNMVLLNNLNFGERLNIVYKNNGDGLQNFESNIGLPFLFNSPLSFEGGLKIFRRDSLFSNNTQKLNLNYQINDKLTIGAGIELTNSTNISQESINLDQNVTDYKSTFYGVNFGYLKPNQKEGFNEDAYLNLKGAVGNRISDRSSTQYQLGIDGQYQLSLDYRNRILFNLSSQFLISDQYFNNELYRFGGINSVRGFAENDLIANQYTILRTEYRYLLDSNLMAKTVLDLGTYKNEQDDIDDNILGYGLGLGLNSKSGLFSIVIANAISSDRDSNLSNTKIHIGFISYF